MNEIPLKVFAILGLEAGVITGLGIIMFYTVRTVYQTTVDNRWTDWSYITGGKDRG